MPQAGFKVASCEWKAKTFIIACHLPSQVSIESTTSNEFQHFSEVIYISQMISVLVSSVWARLVGCGRLCKHESAKSFVKYYFVDDSQKSRTGRSVSVSDCIKDSTGQHQQLRPQTNNRSKLHARDCSATAWTDEQRYFLSMWKTNIKYVTNHTSVLGFSTRQSFHVMEKWRERHKINRKLSSSQSQRASLSLHAGRSRCRVKEKRQ